MTMKKTLIAILWTLLSISMTGCWNYRELETLAVVTGVAVDKGVNSTGYHLSVEILDTSGDGGGDGGGQNAIKSKIIETDGDTIFDAVRNAVKKSDKKLYFSDCKAVIISKQLAGEGIAPILDWLSRDSELRLTLAMFISKENTAKDVLKQQSPTNAITAYSLDKIGANDPQFLSKAPYMQLYQVNNTLGSKGSSLALPALSIAQNQDGRLPQLDGTAVFQKDKLLGFLDSEESKYLLFTKNQVKGGLFVFNESPAVSKITLEIEKSETAVSVIKGEVPKIRVAVKMDTALGEMETSSDFETEDGIEKLQKDASASLTADIRRLITKVQNQYGSDILGFGTTVYKNDPRYWKKIEPQWDELFKSLEVDVSAEVTIKNTALIKKNIKVGG